MQIPVLLLALQGCRSLAAAVSARCDPALAPAVNHAHSSHQRPCKSDSKAAALLHVMPPIAHQLAVGLHSLGLGAGSDFHLSDAFPRWQPIRIQLRGFRVSCNRGLIVPVAKGSLASQPACIAWFAWCLPIESWWKSHQQSTAGEVHASGKRL